MASNGLPAPVPQNYRENGRTYHGFHKGVYMYPCDEEEQDRMDMYHKIFEVARRGALHQAPINPPPPYDVLRILDLGCGTGIWAIDMADKYRNAEVCGIDLVNIQPERIPPNLRFLVPKDYESIWSLGEDSWDLIHLQQACGSVSSWPHLYQKAFAHLKPGTGWIEQVEIDLEPRCDDGTLPPNSYVRQWYDSIVGASHRSGRSIAYQHNTRQMLQNAGFIDIQEIVIRAPFNSWPADPHQKEIGRWYHLGLTEGLEALSLQALFKNYEWSAEIIRNWLRSVRREIGTTKFHAYNNIHIWIARRPGQ